MKLRNLMNYQRVVTAAFSLAVVLFAQTAFADTFSFAASGSSFSLSGTLTADPTGNPNEYLVTAITGVYDGASLGGLLPGGPAVTLSPSGSWSFDNLLYTSDPSLDEYGLGFYLNGGIEANLFWLGNTYVLGYGIASNSTQDSLIVDHFTISSVPEPATLLLLGASLVGLAGTARRKRSPKRRANVTANSEVCSRT